LVQVEQQQQLQLQQGLTQSLVQLPQMAVVLAHKVIWLLIMAVMVVQAVQQQMAEQQEQQHQVKVITELHQTRLGDHQQVAVVRVEQQPMFQVFQAQQAEQDSLVR
jgi:hypothetical protein